MTRKFLSTAAAVRKRAAVGVTAVALTSSGLMALIDEATAATYTNSCSASSINGFDRFNYSYVSNRVNTNTYQYGLTPATGGPRRGQNNVDIDWSTGQGYQSPDTLVRDGYWHDLPGNPTASGLANELNVKFTNIFNTSAQPDPRCSWSHTV